MDQKKNNKPPLEFQPSKKRKSYANSPKIQKDKFSDDSNRKKLPDKKDNILQKIFSELSDLAYGFSSVKQMIESRLSYDKTKEEAFNRLYGELEDMKKNSIFERNRPLYIDLILLFDRIENLRCEAKQESGIPENLFKSFSDELLEILYRQGIQIINTTSPKFSPTIQRAVSTTQTSVKEEDNHIANTVRRGFKYQNHILRPEEVVVKKFIKT